MSRIHVGIRILKLEGDGVDYEFRIKVKDCRN